MAYNKQQPAGGDVARAGLVGLVGVIGAGTMGAGIARVALLAGHEVAVYDVMPHAAERAVAGIVARLDALAAKGRLATTDAAAAAKRLMVAETPAAMSDARIIVEAVAEDLDVKRRLFAEVERIVGTDCLLATNTSSLSVTAIGAAMERPDRLVGMHFFNPAWSMPLVEVVSSLVTDPACADAVAAYARAWGKVAIPCACTPGFIVNRVARPFYGEALRAYEEGLGSFAQIDVAMRRSCRFPLGPFELMDVIGLDVNLAVSTSVWEATGYDPSYTPSWTQKEFVAAGRLGRKSGGGFFEYAPDGGRVAEPVAEPVDEQDVAVWPIDELMSSGAAAVAVSRSLEAVAVRTVARLVNEACDAVRLGVATPADVDSAMLRGVGYPKGPLAWGDALGTQHVLDALDALETHYRDGRYRASPELRRRVASGRALTDA